MCLPARCSAKQTCELAGFSKAAKVDPDLVEWNYGDYEGKTTADIHKERPDWQLFRDGCPGGESVAAVGAPRGSRRRPAVGARRQRAAVFQRPFPARPRRALVRSGAGRRPLLLPRARRRCACWATNTTRTNRSCVSGTMSVMSNDFKCGTRNGHMALSPLAGKPAPKDLLIDVAQLELAVLRAQARPGRPDAAGRLRHQRPPRHVAATAPSPKPTSWPSPRPSANTAAAQGIDGPLFMGKDTHAALRPGPAHRPGSAGRQRRRDRHPARRRRDADAGHLARHPRLQPRPQGPPGRRHRHHAVAQPAGGRRLQVQPAQRRPRRHRRDAAGFRTAPTPCCATTTPA